MAKLAGPIVFAAWIALVSAAGAVTLPRCTAPRYGGEAAIKAIGSDLAWAYHLTMMVNESDQGRFAYCLSLSGMDESGLSFGVSQLDLRTNPKAWLVFMEILRQAGREQALLAFDDAQLAHMKARMVSRAAPRGEDLLRQDDPRLDPLLIRANEALRSTSSRQIIDAIHTEHVKHAVGLMTQTQDELRSSSIGAGQLLESSLVAKLLLMDYRNLFGEDISNKLQPFLMTGTVTLTSGPVRMSGQTLAVRVVSRLMGKMLGRAFRCVGDVAA